MDSKLYTILKDNQGTVKIAGFAVMCTLMLSGYIQTLLINTLILSYLSYKTFKNINQPPTHTNLLKYWVCFSMLSVFEVGLSYIFSTFMMSVIYNAIKIGGFVLMLQNNETILIAYDGVIVPLFSKYETYIDSWFSTLETKAQQYKSVTPVNYNLWDYFFAKTKAV